MRLLRRPRPEPVEVETGIVLDGHVWVGDGTEIPAGRVVVDTAGRVAAVGAASEVGAPAGATHVTGGWVGPGLYDAHVHLTFGRPADVMAGGVVAVRDLGAPPREALRWRTLATLQVTVAGPLLTAPGGYPSKSWGSEGFVAFVDDSEQAARLVTGLAPQVDVVKLALEPSGGPVPTAEVASAVVDSAHAAGRTVVCHALSVAMVERALDAGVDELAHTPVEPLPDELVDRLAGAAVGVVSTLQTFVHGGCGDAAVANAAALVAAGVDVRYGTDLGNGGTSPGADPRELQLLATRAGLGADGALRAATRPLVVGEPAGVVTLDLDPRERPKEWRRPRAVAVGRMLLHRAGR